MNTNLMLKMIILMNRMSLLENHLSNKHLLVVEFLKDIHLPKKLIIPDSTKCYIYQVNIVRLKL